VDGARLSGSATNSKDEATKTARQTDFEREREREIVRVRVCVCRIEREKEGERERETVKNDQIIKCCAVCK